jgi:hypothetical protein
MSRRGTRCKTGTGYGPCGDFCRFHSKQFALLQPEADDRRGTHHQWLFEQEYHEMVMYTSGYEEIYLYKQHAWEWVFYYELMKRVENRHASLIQAVWRFKIHKRNKLVSAADIIKRHFFKSISNPEYKMCRDRLQREFASLTF